MRKLMQLVGQMKDVERPQSVIDVTDAFNEYLEDNEKVDKLEFVFEQPSMQEVSTIQKMVTKIRTQYPKLEDEFAGQLAITIMAYKGSKVTEKDETEFQEADASSWVMLAGFFNKLGINDPAMATLINIRFNDAFPKLRNPQLESDEIKNE